MSEATTRAYAAAAEALKLNVLAYGGTLLDLDVFTERLVESAEDPHGVDIVVEIRPGLEITFPLVTTSMKEWRRRGPGSPTEMLIRALGRLAMMRVWRRRGTVAPPAGLLEVNRLGKALIERAGVDPQAFFDATWSSVCQIASKRDPLFASNFDPLMVSECHGSDGFGAVMGMELLGRLERREGVARPEFQPPQQQILSPCRPGISCGF